MAVGVAPVAANNADLGIVLAGVFAAEGIEVRAGATVTAVSPHAAMVSFADGTAITSGRDAGRHRPTHRSGRARCRCGRARRKCAGLSADILGENPEPAD
jgi:hypothetical protein